MSYCVQCGVELEETATKCVLCGTEVLHPNPSYQDHDLAPYNHTGSSQPYRGRFFAVVTICAIIFAINLICLITNMVYTPHLLWSFIVLTSTVFLGLAIAFPIASKKFSGIAYTVILGIAGAVLLSSIAYVAKSFMWFSQLALPLLVLTTGIVLIGIFLKRRYSLKGLDIVPLILFLCAVVLLGYDGLITYYIQKSLYLSWSIIAGASCIAVGAVVLAITENEKLRSAFRKHFHI